MNPSYMVSKKSRKASRFYNTHRHVHVPNRSRSYRKSLYGSGFAGAFMRGIAMLRKWYRLAGKRAEGMMEATP